MTASYHLPLLTGMLLKVFGNIGLESRAISDAAEMRNRVFYDQRAVINAFLFLGLRHKACFSHSNTLFTILLYVF